MIYRCILPQWAYDEDPGKRRVYEGQFTDDEIKQLNDRHYNIYFLPNHPKEYDPTVVVDGSHIDEFQYVFVDMDLKSGDYKDKESFLEVLNSFSLPPTVIVDSGNGIHAYWELTDLDALSFLRLQRRLTRHFKTDEAVSKIYQLMRVPNTYNTKIKDSRKLCSEIQGSSNSYSTEQMSNSLPTITPSDESYCQQHFNRTYKINEAEEVDDKIPLKFADLLKSSAEVKELWLGNTDDRSKADYRLGHIMFANGFTKQEATSVLVNTAKASQRAPAHRVNYATNIVDKIWLYEQSEDKESLNLSSSVKDILNRHGDELKGTRFPCWTYIDDTLHGFRLGHVVGLVAGSGVGKTAFALNMFEGFVNNNPDYDHFFVTLEQPDREIADRWRTMCGDKTHLHDKVHVLSNYNADGSFRHLSFDDIKDYILKFQEVTKRKVGCVVIDHIGALKKKNKNGENQDLMDICHSMKAFSVQTNTLLVMQSQAPREKAGIGDLELNKDAAYGTVYFESYCDYLVTIHQPVKRCYNDKACPTVMAFKFCKIRHKKKEKDKIQEDVMYTMFFDSNTERLRELTQAEEKSFDFFNRQAVNKRKQDRKTDVLTYTSVRSV